MDMREKVVNRDELRDVFGVTVPAFDIQRGLYSHESPECGGIAVKYRQFENFYILGFSNLQGQSRRDTEDVRTCEGQQSHPPEID